MISEQVCNHSVTSPYVNLQFFGDFFLGMPICHTIKSPIQIWVIPTGVGSQKELFWGHFGLFRLNVPNLPTDSADLGPLRHANRLHPFMSQS